MTRQLQPQLGQFLFDGTLLYTMRNLGRDDLTYTVTKQGASTPTKIIMKLVGEVNPCETRYAVVLNIILRRCMEHLQLQQVGRDYFDASPQVSAFFYMLYFRDESRSYVMNNMIDFSLYFRRAFPSRSGS
jgi:hypothetical protein